MFDTYRIQQGASHTSVSIKEERAPTDESVRLLKEMESAARSKVIESIRLESADLKAVVHRHESVMDLTTTFNIHYAINGHRREVRVVSFDGGPTKDRVQEIWKAIAEDIATFLLANFTKGIRP